MRDSNGGIYIGIYNDFFTTLVLIDLWPSGLESSRTSVRGFKSH